MHVKTNVYAHTINRKWFYCAQEREASYLAPLQLRVTCAARAAYIIFCHASAFIDHGKDIALIYLTTTN